MRGISVVIALVMAGAFGAFASGCGSSSTATKTVTQSKKSQFNGTGTYGVGTDILPGTYRASASPGCYWARLSSSDTSITSAFDNADGPVIVTILPTDKAFQAKDCATFHKVG